MMMTIDPSTLKNHRQTAATAATAIIIIPRVLVYFLHVPFSLMNLILLLLLLRRR